MRLAELVLLFYFGYLAVGALAARVGWRARAAVCAGSLAMCAITGLVTREGESLGVWRDAFPAAGIAIGYWLPRALFPGVNLRQEAALVASDRWLLGKPAVLRVMARIGPGARELFEVAYLLVYPMVPAGAVIVWWTDPAAIDRYWATVLIATLGAYGTLPWIATRTPRVLERIAPCLSIQAVSHRVMHVVSHELNTFPSGHASASLAVALALIPTSGALAAAFGGLALAISAASVLGRYHFVLDVLAGMALGVVAWAAMR